MEIEKLKSEIKEIGDPRRKWGNLRHKLEDILIIGLCSIICCGEDFTDMEDFGNDREEWLRGFLELPNGIPDSDTFRSVYERLEPNAVAKSLNAWLDDSRNSGGRNVNIDGKTICGSKKPGHSAYHVVSAWVEENQITLGEIATDEKGNEITAIPELLDSIDIAGDIVTIYAMGCQTDIAGKIRDKEADYVLALKDTITRPCMRMSKITSIGLSGNIRKAKFAIVGKAGRRNVMGESKRGKFWSLRLGGWKVGSSGEISKR